MSKGALTRQKIIEEAALIFNQRGYAGSSMQDIMKATGLEKGGLYRHFASKEDVAVEAFKYALERSVRTRTGDISHIHGSIAKLRYAVERFVEAPSSIRGGCPLMNTAIDADDGNPTLRKLARTGFNDWKTRICKIVEEGIHSGEIRTDVEPRIVANTIIATLEGALTISRMEGTREALRDARSSLEVQLSAIARR